jgi:hypothetical protein
MINLYKKNDGPNFGHNFWRVWWIPGLSQKPGKHQIIAEDDMAMERLLYGLQPDSQFLFKLSFLGLCR